MEHKFQRILATALSAALMWTSGEGAHATGFAVHPSMDSQTPLVHFLRNEEKMRLETQALSELVVNCGMGKMLKHPHSLPFLSRLADTYRTLLRDSSTAFHLGRLWEASTPWVTVLDAAAITGSFWLHANDLALGFSAALTWHLALWSVYAVVGMVLGAQPILDWLSLACGGLGLRFRIPPELRDRSRNPGVLPPKERNILMAMKYVTGDRGIHEAGFFARLPEADLQVAKETAQNAEQVGAARFQLSPSGGYRWVGDKIVIVKRDDMPKELDRVVQKALIADAKGHEDVELPEHVLVTAHTRRSTYSDPTDPDEAHPHFGEKVRQATIHRVQNGQLVKTVTPVEVTVTKGVEPVDIAATHNGDKDTFRWWGTGGHLQVHQKEAKRRAKLILDTPSDLKLDSEGIPLFTSILRTQGDAFAALRLAFQQTIPWDDQKRLPTRLELTRWTSLMEQVFEETSKRLLEPGLKDLSQVDNGKRQLFIETLVKEFGQAVASHAEFMGPLPKEFLYQFMEHAGYNFLRNDLFQAAREYARRAGGSFGVCITSTIDEDPVFYSSQQPYYIARHRAEDRQGWDSEGRALAVQVQDENGEWVWAFQERLLLNQERQEVARLRQDHTLEIYDVKANRMLEPEEVQKRWIDMTRSPRIHPVRVSEGEVKPVRVSIAEASKLFAAARENWDNPDSDNRKIARELAALFVDLARKQKRSPEGHLPRGAHVVVTGFKEYEFAWQFGDFLKDVMPDLRIEFIPANDVLLDPVRAARKHAITEDTIVIDFCRSGQDFPDLNAVTDFKTQGVTNIFVVTGGEPGDLDTVMASLLGQSYEKGAPPARVITTGQPRPRRQAQVNNHPLTTLAGNRMISEIILALRREFPHGTPLGLETTEEEVQTALEMEKGLQTAVTSITGADAKGEKVPSKLHKAITALARAESPDFREKRTLKWLYRGTVLFPLLYAANETKNHWMPHVLIPGLSAALPGLGIARAVFDLEVIIGMGMVLLLVIRLIYRRQIPARLETRKLSFVDSEVHSYAQDFYRMLEALAYPEASASAEGAHPTGAQNKNYLRDIVPTQNRGGLTLKSRPDDRFAFREAWVSAMDKVGILTRTNRSINFSRYILKINRYLKRWFKRRIQFGLTRVITFRRSGILDDNVEDADILMETHYFPLPRPMVAFFQRLSKMGIEISIDQQATFFAARRRYEHTALLLTDRKRIGKELAQEIGLNGKAAADFAIYFSKHGLTLFEFSEEERARQDRLQEFVFKRMHSIENYLAMAAVFGEAFVDPNANPLVFRHQRYPMGRSHEGELIPTTPAPVPGTRVFERLRQFTRRKVGASA